MRKNSIKNIRINSEVQKELSLIIGDLKDPRVDPLTSVTDVIVTTDLKFATVYVSVMGDEEHQRQTLEGLNSANGFIRRELAARVNLRNTPELKYVLDKSMEYGVKMDRLIDEVISHDKANHVYDEYDETTDGGEDE